MATQKSCSGSTSIIGFALASPLCIYQLTLTVDLVPITNTVPINSGMTPAQVAALLNSNRTGNTTGTISAQLVGNNLQITITGIVLPTGALGMFGYTILGTGLPCGDFPVQLPSALVCSIIPVPRPKKHGIIGGGLRFSDIICVNPIHYPKGRPATLNYFGVVNYDYSYTDTRGFWCYRMRRVVK